MANKFAKAKVEQAYIKLGVYGKQGSGKTLTSLLIGEGLAVREGKRIAYIDTERGTDFYCKEIPERTCHPKAFDFDRIVTRSMMETLEAVQEIDTNQYGVLVIDSITHLWEAAKEAYKGKRTAKGGIPIQAWGDIKRPYKQLMTEFLNGKYHAILCGREGVEMQENDDGELEVVGAKMKAEGETAYEPHFLVRMRPERLHDGTSEIRAFFEKDRSGILTGRTVANPSFSTIEPVLRYLSDEHGTVATADEASEKDAAIIQQKQERDDAERRQLYEHIRSAIASASTVDALKSAWSLTQGKKGKLGDLFDHLEIAKETRKSELMKAVA